MQGLPEIILSILGGGGIVGILTKYISTQHEERIKDLKLALEKAETRALRAEDTVIIAVQALPAIESHLDRNSAKLK